MLSLLTPSTPVSVGKVEIISVGEWPMALRSVVQPLLIAASAHGPRTCHTSQDPPARLWDEGDIEETPSSPVALLGTLG